MSAEAAILAQEVHVQPGDRDALVDRRRPEPHNGAADAAGDRLDLVAGHLGEPRQRMTLARRDPHAHLRQHAVEPHGVEEVPAGERCVDGCREAREIRRPHADRLDVGEPAHDRERQDLVVAHGDRRTVERALDRRAVDDHDLAAEVVDAAQPEVPDRPRLGDAHARLVGAGEQGVEHGELRHGGAGHGRRSHHVGASLTRPRGARPARRRARPRARPSRRPRPGR